MKKFIYKSIDVIGACILMPFWFIGQCLQIAFVWCFYRKVD